MKIKIYRSTNFPGRIISPLEDALNQRQLLARVDEQAMGILVFGNVGQNPSVLISDALASNGGGFVFVIFDETSNWETRRKFRQCGIPENQQFVVGLKRGANITRIVETINSQLQRICRA